MIEYHHFANLNKLMALGFNHCGLLISQKERQPNITCLLIKHTPLPSSHAYPQKKKKERKKNQT